MKRQKRVLSPAFIVGADAKIAPYCVANLAKASALSSMPVLAKDDIVPPSILFPLMALSAIAVALFVEVTTPVRFPILVTVPAVKLAAVPLIFVPTNVDGVPKFGVVKVRPASVNAALALLCAIEVVPI